MLSETFYFCILKCIKLLMLSMFQHTYYLVTLSEILSDSPLPDRWRSELRAVAEWGEGPGQALSRDLGPGSWDVPSLVTRLKGCGVSCQRLRVAWTQCWWKRIPHADQGSFDSQTRLGWPDHHLATSKQAWGCVEGPVWGIISEEAELGFWGRRLSHLVGFWSQSVSPGCCNCVTYRAGEKMGTVKSWW